MKKEIILMVVCVAIGFLFAGLALELVLVFA